MASSATLNKIVANNVLQSTEKTNGVSIVHTVSPEDPEFTNISLDPENPPKRKKKKVPRRILHFNDGILEEYSTDEEDEEENKLPAVDTKTLNWSSWLWHYVTTAASNTLFAADTCGEKLAWFFGITTPKYQYAIDEHNRIKAEEEQEQKEEAMIIQEQHDQQSSVLQSTEEGLTDIPDITIRDKAPVVLEKY